MQVGSVVGFFSTPIVAIVWRIPFSRALRASVNRSSFGFFLIGMSLLAGKTYSGALDELSVDDRAYRMAHNKGQLETDRVALQGAAAGLICTTLLGQVGVRSLLAYSLTGMSLSLSGYVASKALQSPRGKQLASQVEEQFSSLFNKSN